MWLWWCLSIPIRIKPSTPEKKNTRSILKTPVYGTPNHNIRVD